MRTTWDFTVQAYKVYNAWIVNPVPAPDYIPMSDGHVDAILLAQATIRKEVMSCVSR